jgi:CHASE2 domain-containing sensor protein
MVSLSKKGIFVRNAGPFWPHVRRLRFVFTFVALILVSTLLSETTAFQQLSNLGLDLWQNLGPRKHTQWCRLVAITDAEYGREFRGQSPLNPQVLSDAITALLKYEPAVLAVDIDTSHELFLTVPRPSHPTIPIVWARDGEIESEKPLSIRPFPVWGRPEEEPEHSGLALLPSDLDGLIRVHRRTWLWGTKTVDSFHWAIVRAYCAKGDAPGCMSVAASSDKSGELFLTPARERDDLRPSPLSDFWHPHAAISERNILKNKVVILGGTFQAAREEHPTPLGPRFGVEVVGDAVESDIAGDHLSILPGWIRYVVKVLLALSIATAYHYLTPRWAFRTTSALLFAVIALGSLAAFVFGSYWADYVPLLLGLWIEQLYDQSEVAQLYYESQATKPNPARRKQRK